MKLLIVESPAKAKTINKYLGSDYTVISSHGHVRSLPSEEGAVKPDSDFAMEYKILPKSSKQVNTILSEAKKSDAIYLATDPDREGEAISWHIAEILRSKSVIKKVPIKRVVFHEITKNAVLEAMNHARDIDLSLVEAQQTRQALDYLVGFTISPVLWRKLPGSKSAGRVQSVALRVVCEREEEIERFNIQEYWSVSADFLTHKAGQFTAELMQFDGKKLEKLAITNEQSAVSIVNQLKSLNYIVGNIEKKQTKRNPSAPFSTSTLMQEASRKLGFSPRKTAQVAQKLYEGVSIGGELVGLITYMRTDSVSISQETVDAAIEFIQKEFGKDYLPSEQRVYKTKTKNAQEAHEAIRPTDIKRAPKYITNALDSDQAKLYELIWNRTMASQMASAVFDVVRADIPSSGGVNAIFRANGSTMIFPGFYKIYREGLDDSEEEKQNMLPPLEINDKLDLQQLDKHQHFTQPPPRYTEASLVKKMEELGIGRPSTYPSVLSILQTRQYVNLDKKRFTPEIRGRLVNAFLIQFFNQYVEYHFTADLENKLDDIAGGRVNWKHVLKEFWYPFREKADDALGVKITDVLNGLETVMLPYIFSKDLKNGKTMDECRKCNVCQTGKLVLKNGRYGSFLGCSNYPECNNIQRLGEEEHAITDDGNQGDFPKILGNNPAGEEISIKKGPYGLYIQLGEGKKVKRSSIPKNVQVDRIDLDYAIQLLNLPRSVNAEIRAGIGKFGAYLERDGKYTSLRGTEYDPITITEKQAIDLIAKKMNTKKSKDQK